MSKKIHLVKSSLTCALPDGTLGRPPSFCGETKSKNTLGVASYMWHKKYGRGMSMDESRICKACIKWVPMYTLATLDSRTPMMFI